jgi:hypothetical protein
MGQLQTVRLKEVLELFSAFGIREGDVRSALMLGDGAFNAFEGLKAKVDLCWLEFQDRVESGEMDAESLEALRPNYCRLAKIKLKTVIMKKEISQIMKEEVRRIADRLIEQGVSPEEVREYFGKRRAAIKEEDK